MCARARNLLWVLGNPSDGSKSQLCLFWVWPEWCHLCIGSFHIQFSDGKEWEAKMFAKEACIDGEPIPQAVSRPSRQSPFLVHQGSKMGRQCSSRREWIPGRAGNPVLSQADVKGNLFYGFDVLFSSLECCLTWMCYPGLRDVAC